MYNEKQKSRFIEFKEAETVMPNNYIKGIFEQAQQFEELYDKDLCNFGREEILDFYSYLGYISYASYRMVNSLLSHYNSWCFLNGLVIDGQNHYTEIRNQDLVECINRRLVNNSIISAGELYELINKCENPRDKFLILSLFEFGTSKLFGDILNIKIDDIDMEKNILHLQTRDVKVSDLWIKIAQEANDTFIFIPYDDNDRYEMKLVDNGFIFKYSTRVRVEGGNREGRRVSQMYRALRKYLELPDSLTPKSIINSGRIHVIKTESKRLGINAKDYCMKYRDELANQFGVRFVPTNFLAEFKNYL